MEGNHTQQLKHLYQIKKSYEKKIPLIKESQEYINYRFAAWRMKCTYDVMEAYGPSKPIVWVRVLVSVQMENSKHGLNWS